MHFQDNIPCPGNPDWEWKWVDEYKKGYSCWAHIENEYNLPGLSYFESCHLKLKGWALQLQDDSESKPHIVCESCANKAGIYCEYSSNITLDVTHMPEYSCPTEGYIWKWVDKLYWGGKDDPHPSPLSLFGCTGFADSFKPEGANVESQYGCKNKSGTIKTPWALQLHHKDLSTGHILCETCANGVGLFRNQGIESMGKVSSTCMGCETKVCNVCAVCHTATCDFIGLKVTTPAQRLKYNHLMAKTQKARGYVTLADIKLLPTPTPYRVVMSEADIEPVVKEMRGKKGFVRPCPMRPRHGFVDSRPINVGDESVQVLKDILAQATAADDQGHAELLVMPYIESAFNVVAMPTRVAIGPGHDGATAGHGSISIPLAGVPFSEISPEVLMRARVDDRTEDPYIEAVIDKGGNPYFTQIRAGVKIPSTVGSDFIPEMVRVEEVIEASGDLLEWEAQTKRIKRGTVVCHVGGTLTSHYGVHCMQNNIPVMTSRRPEVGEVLDVINRMEKPNVSAVIRGLGAGAVIPLSLSSAAGSGNRDKDGRLKVPSALAAMMLTLHNSAAMGGEDGFWLGAATAIMMRAGMAASHGEARHKIPGMKLQRGHVYKMAFEDFFGARNTLGQAQWRFTKQSWSSGYGGEAWGKCTEAIIELDMAARMVIVEPTQENVGKMVTALNNAVNQAHNNGWWLNKFTQKQCFDAAAVQSLKAVVSGAAGMFGMADLARTVDAESAAKLWGEAGEITVEQGKMIAETAPKTGDTGWHDPYEIEKVPDPEEYVGAYCSSCGWKYTYEKKDIVYSTYCKDGWCGAHVGWFEDGMFSIPLDTNDTSHNDECSCSDCCPDPDPDDDIDFEPSMPVPVVKLSKNTNHNGMKVSSDVVVTEAQMQFLKGPGGAQVVHLQWRLEGIEGYFSTNVVQLPHTWLEYEVPNVPNVLSWSGSGVDNYMKMEVKNGGNYWELTIPKIEMRLALVPHLEHAQQLAFKQKESNEDGQTTAQTESQDESGPF